VIKLKTEYEFFPEETKKVLFGLLEFNPHKRLSTYEALKLPMFNPMKSAELEKISDTKIILEMD